MKENTEIVVGLDIGTSNTRVLIGEADRTGGDIRIIGAASHLSRGLRKGEVVDIKGVLDILEKVVSQVEQDTGREISSVVTGIRGGNIRGMNSRALVPVAKPRAGISRKDMGQAISAAQGMTIPPEQEAIQVIPQEFVVDGRDGVHEPLGIVGSRLEARVHIITVPLSSVQNRMKVINHAGLAVDAYILEPLAASLAVLRREEQQSGVLLLDLGGGTTGYVVFLDDAPRHSAVLGLGGDHITNDISIGLKLLQQQAEKLKIKFGLHPELDIKQENCPVPGGWGRPSATVSCRTLGKIIEPRATEIFIQVRKDLEELKLYRSLSSGVVLTGGVSLMKGVEELAARVLELPVRAGSPVGISGLLELVNSPSYATAVGLVKYGFQSLACGGLNHARRRGWSISGLKNFIGRYF